jgi:hypothetical protein
VISLGPHHDGTPLAASDAAADAAADAGADEAAAASEAGAAEDSLLVEELLQAARASAATPTLATKMTRLRERVICTSLLVGAALAPRISRCDHRKLIGCG